MFNGERIIADDSKCVACQRCVVMCPASAIKVIKNDSFLPPHGNYTQRIRNIIWAQSGNGGVLLSATGNDRPIPSIFDDLLLDACQVTNPAIDPLRETIETKVYFGRKPQKLQFSSSKKDFSDVELNTHFMPNFEINMPTSCYEIRSRFNTALSLCKRSRGLHYACLRRSASLP